MKPIDIKHLNNILLFIILISVILHFGREFFIIIIFSAFLAMLMTPVSNKLESYRFSRILSSFISILIIIAVLTSVGYLFSFQIGTISGEFPQIKSKLLSLINDVQGWISNQFGISSEQQINALKERASETLTSIGTFFTGLLKGTISFVGGVILVLVFTFLFLLQREKYENFLVMLYKDEKRNETKNMIDKISKIAQQYLTGRLISIFLLTILYIIGFYAIGLKHAILLSAIAAVFSFVPYVGTVVGAIFPFFMAFVEGSPTLAFWVIIVVSVTHVFQNYFIEPYFVGGSVNISPFFTIFILVLGGVVWGIAGVILFLPLLGIVKIILENTKTLYPYAYLIGTQEAHNSYEKLWSSVKKFIPGKKRGS